jgi:hypothetical protein
VSFNGTIIIFNGRERNVLEFKQDSEILTIIGNLPFKTATSIVLSTTAIPKGQDVVWLFAGNEQRVTNPILIFNTTNKVVYIPSVNSTSLPSLYVTPVSVWDGRQGYLIGGFGRV